MYIFSVYSVSRIDRYHENTKTKDMIINFKDFII